LLETDYESRRNGDRRQIIKRRPVYEANNTMFWDPNAKMLDKSDADYVCLLTAYSEDGFRKLVEDLTGEEDISPDTFKAPEHSYVFPWVGGSSEVFYVGEFFHRELVEEQVFVLESPFGDTIEVSEEDLEEDELIDGGYDIVAEKTIERYRVTKYIVSGREILNGEVDEETGEREGELIAGENLPVVPVYGERAFVEGEEHWEGVTRLAKDPQRLRNFQLSYLADISSRSPRDKEIFLQEQIAGFEDMYTLSGSENNYAYLLQNKTDDSGQDLPQGPVGTMRAPQIPQALAALLGETRVAIEDVATPGTHQDYADVDLSGKAVLALQARLDLQSMVYQENMRHAKRRDGEIYASMSAEIMDVPRKVKIELPDGTKKTVQVMETILTEEGELKTINDLSNTEFEVHSRIGASYTSQREKTLERISQIIQTLPPNDPMVNILTLKAIELTDGIAFDDVRDYARKQQILQGVREPETDKEKLLLEQAMNQPKEPTAEMVLAMAEEKKGQAEMMNAQLKAADTQLKAENESLKRQVDMYKAQTDRMGVTIDAQEAGAKIDNTNVDTMGKQLENQQKAKELLNPANMSTDAILAELGAL
jgi:hypothetical protein